MAGRRNAAITGAARRRTPAATSGVVSVGSAPCATRERFQSVPNATAEAITLLRPVLMNGRLIPEKGKARTMAPQIQTACSARSEVRL